MGKGSESRWTAAELAAEYREAFGATDLRGLEDLGVSSRTILTRWLRWSGPVTRAAILERYAFDPAWLDATLGSS